MNILWDFDGTLFDTYPAFTKTWRGVLGDTPTEEDILKQLKISFHHAFSYFNISEEQIKLFKEKSAALPPEEKPPFPYVEEILKLADKNVIMTHKEREEAIEILEYYNWDKYFTEIVAGDDGFPRKPDTKSYEYLHQKHNIDLAIGDRELDIIPARKLGIKTCLFQNNAKGADYYLDKYEDFVVILLAEYFEFDLGGDDISRKTKETGFLPLDQALESIQAKKDPAIVRNLLFQKNAAEKAKRYNKEISDLYQRLLPFKPE
ncbi:HAD family hydrolase [Pseudalkalibacillus caeni]|uniref:HAD family hydrolase n=1 Tax=Exobacillus caeni TaxID=2574798 RepID=A0A5R9F5C5_9BACL|nr:HAD family hydrolase [Pseudalkalibacillus caeni]